VNAGVTLILTRFTVTIEINPDWQSGVGSSIVVGIRYAMNLAPNLEAAVLLACGQPFVNVAVLTQLMQFRLTTGKPIVAPAYAETLGIPALFDRSCFPDLLRLKGDSDAKGIILARHLLISPPGRSTSGLPRITKRSNNPSQQTARGWDSRTFR
jgi:CTP:molybdopterin cytidylyltransferase MocA